LKPVLLAALVGVVLAGTAEAAEEMGRLFLTPEQRAALEARRKARQPDKPAAAAVAPITRVDGYVRRQGGNSTIWLNGEPFIESRTPGARREPGKAGQPGVAVPLGDESRSSHARVGQSVDSATGEVKDPLGEGEIRVRRTPEKAQARK
jgi:hypothetical protein